MAQLLLFMDIPSNWVSYTAAWALILLSRHFHRRGRLLNLPPVPKPWPNIRNLNLIGPLPHCSIHELSKKQSSRRMKDYLSDLTLNVISRMVLGKNYAKKTEGTSIVTPEEFNHMFILNGVLGNGDSIPWVNFLDLEGYVNGNNTEIGKGSCILVISYRGYMAIYTRVKKLRKNKKMRMKAVNKKFNRFLEHALDEHERGRGGEGYGDKDMVDVLLWLADDPNLVVKLERHGVKLFTLLLRGHEFPQRGGKPEWIAPPNPGRRPWLRLLKKIAASDHLVLQFESIKSTVAPPQAHHRNLPDADSYTVLIQPPPLHLFIDRLLPQIQLAKSSIYTACEKLAFDSKNPNAGERIRWTANNEAWAGTGTDVSDLIMGPVTNLSSQSSMPN
ncbi:hypothetical protein CDL15_Pgr013786 [Punica granatum]|uniref:Cytochrome P450 n=1 Tax=Punica granatum TaxID=22663 RepID=A0A218W231_PUNGR|nr:hypothetical protein CDL15_Pgr013786 [Punica granatum]